MINIRKQLPDVYYNESRDFQLIGRFVEAIANYNKMSVDCMQNLLDAPNLDEKLVNLLAKTIGFESRHEYDVHNLKIICGSFYDIIKYKGTKKAIDKAISALLNSQGIDDEFDSYLEVDKQSVEITIPSQTSDIILLKDLFEYILPIGWTYSITTGIAGGRTKYMTNVKTGTSYTAPEKGTWELDKIAKLNGGESGDETKPTSISVVSDKNESGD